MHACFRTVGISLPAAALVALSGCGDVEVPEAEGTHLSPPSACDLDGRGADGVIHTFHTLPSTESLTRLAADGDALYWFDDLQQRIVRQGFGDAAPQVFVAATGLVDGPVLDDAFVYWRTRDTTASVIHRAPKSDGAAVVDLYTGLILDAGLAVDADWLWFAEVTEAASSIRRIPKGGGDTETLVAGELRISQVVVEATALHWIAAASSDPPDPSEGGTDPATAIRSLADGENAAATLVEGSHAWLAPSAAGDGVLYYLDYRPGWSLDVYGWSSIGAVTPGPSVEVPAQGPSLFSVPVSDAACAYWVAPRPPLDEDGGLYDVQRAPHGGGAVETIATIDVGDSMQRFPSVALSGEAVYWSLGANYEVDDHIYRTSK
jgi:hypothetical protein